MNENFHALPKEKQTAIVNAAIEVFAQNDYKRASTDLIAAKAGISKGLLFYYFHNKKELYLYVYQYAADIMRTQVVDPAFLEMTDFFALLEYASLKKVAILKDHPHLVDFALRAFYSEREDVSESLKTVNQSFISEAFDAYFKNVDFGKFREDVDPLQIYQMLLWMADGYLHQLQMQKISLELPVLEEMFRSWCDFFKKNVYKEEFL